jgi:hypothetical protein
MFTVTVILIIIIPIIFSLNYRKAESRMAGLRNEDNPADFLNIDVKITKISTEDYTYSLLMKINPAGITKNSSNISRVERDMVIFVKSQPFEFPAGHSMSEISFQTNFETGTSFLYPFDSYEDELNVTAIVSPRSNSSRQSIPTKVNYVGTFKELDVLFTTDSLPPHSLLRIKISRSGTTKFFSVSIIFLMWLLSFTILTLSVSVWTRKRTVEPPVMFLF